MSKTGGYNLLLLGTGAILISIITTAISLVIYHNSGDIYLDRSRPGFLPDASEQTTEDSNLQEYKFSDFGEINKDTLEEYLKNAKETNEALLMFTGDLMCQTRQQEAATRSKGVSEK